MNSNFLTGYQCISCEKLFPADPFFYTCTGCGNNLDAVYDYSAIRSQWSQRILSENPDRSIWRYKPLLPVKSMPPQVSIQVGGTPLISGNRLAEELGIRSLWLKDDTRNPSGSLKDRATEVGIQHADEQSADIIIVASTGNAAASLACLCAWRGKQAIILVPSSAPGAKLTQILQYGAKLFPVEGSYDDAFELAQEIGKEFAWYSRNTGTNPVLSEGKKTVALEMAEQLKWNIPDQVFVPVGDGCIIGGVYKGFYDLLQLGWIDHIPKIVAVQADGSAAIVNALSGKSLKAVQADTIADSISVNYPRDGVKAIRAIKESDGYGVTVSDHEILTAQHQLAKTTGIFAEPAASAAVAGLVKAINEGKVRSNEQVCVLITGTGLKDIYGARKLIKIPKAIKPSLDRFTQEWEKGQV